MNNSLSALKNSFMGILGFWFFFESILGINFSINQLKIITQLNVRFSLWCYSYCICFLRFFSCLPFYLWLYWQSAPCLVLPFQNYFLLLSLSSHFAYVRILSLHRSALLIDCQLLDGRLPSLFSICTMLISGTCCTTWLFSFCFTVMSLHPLPAVLFIIRRFSLITVVFSGCW